MNVSVISDLLAQAEKITIRRASSDEIVGKAREELEQARQALAAAEALVAERSKVLEVALAPRLDGDNEVEAIYGRLEEFGVERDVAEAQVEARIASVRALMGVPTQEAPATAAAVEAPQEAEATTARRGRGRPAAQPASVEVVAETLPEAIAEAAPEATVDAPEPEVDSEVVVAEAGPPIDEEDPGIEESDGDHPYDDYDTGEQPEELPASEEADGSDEGEVVTEEAEGPAETEVAGDAELAAIQVTVSEPAPVVEPAPVPAAEPGVTPASRRRSGELPAFLR